MNEINYTERRPHEKAPFLARHAINDCFDTLTIMGGVAGGKENRVIKQGMPKQSITFQCLALASRGKEVVHFSSGTYYDLRLLY